MDRWAAVVAVALAAVFALAFLYGVTHPPSITASQPQATATTTHTSTATAAAEPWPTASWVYDMMANGTVYFYYPDAYVHYVPDPNGELVWSMLKAYNESQLEQDPQLWQLVQFLGNLSTGYFVGAASGWYRPYFNPFNSTYVQDARDYLGPAVGNYSFVMFRTWHPASEPFQFMPVVKAGSILLPYGLEIDLVAAYDSSSNDVYLFIVETVRNASQLMELLAASQALQQAAMPTVSGQPITGRPDALWSAYVDITNDNASAMDDSSGPVVSYGGTYVNIIPVIVLLLPHYAVNYWANGTYELGYDLLLQDLEEPVIALYQDFLPNLTGQIPRMSRYWAVYYVPNYIFMFTQYNTNYNEQYALGRLLPIEPDTTVFTFNEDHGGVCGDYAEYTVLLLTNSVGVLGGLEGFWAPGWAPHEVGWWLVPMNETGGFTRFFDNVSRATDGALPYYGVIVVDTAPGLTALYWNVTQYITQFVVEPPLMYVPYPYDTGTNYVPYLEEGVPAYLYTGVPQAITRLPGWLQTFELQNFSWVYSQFVREYGSLSNMERGGLCRAAEAGLGWYPQLLQYLQQNPTIAVPPAYKLLSSPPVVVNLSNLTPALQQLSSELATACH